MALDDIDFDVEAGHDGRHPRPQRLAASRRCSSASPASCSPTRVRSSPAGRLAALLELGAGFNPELTGRENVYMNASILGLSKKDTDAIFDEIVAFSELEKFIDMQVRHYSSGMYVRLGFAVAVNVDPDILLVDEVLSVGDEAFQRKCIERVAQFQKRGSHDPVRHARGRPRAQDRATGRSCSTTATMIADAPPGEAVRMFRERCCTATVWAPTSRWTKKAPATASRSGQSLSTGPDSHHRRRRSSTRAPLEDRQLVAPRRSVSDPSVVPRRRSPPTTCCSVSRSTTRKGNNIFGANTQSARPARTAVRPGRRGHVRLRARAVARRHLSRARLAIQSTDEGTVYDWREQQYQFSVMNPTRTAGLVSLPVEVRFEQDGVVTSRAQIQRIGSGHVRCSRRSTTSLAPLYVAARATSQACRSPSSRACSPIMSTRKPRRWRCSDNGLPRSTRRSSRCRTRCERCDPRSNRR